MASEVVRQRKRLPSVSFYGIAWAIRLFQTARRNRQRRRVGFRSENGSEDEVTVDPVAEQLVPNVESAEPAADPYALKWGLRFNPKWVLKPWSRWYFVWLTVVSLAVMYNLLIIFPRSVFEQMEQMQSYRIAWIIIDYFCDFVYLCDMLVNLLTGYLENGVTVREPRLLWKKYRTSSRFKLDVLSILPTDFCFIFTGQVVPYVVVRINRLLRLPRLSECIYRAETRSDSPIVFRIGVLLGVLVVFTHINGCLYYFISSTIGVGSDVWVYPATAQWNLNGSHADDTIFQKWIFCTYWSAMMLTSIIPNMNNPTTSAELIFHCADMLLGVVLFATIVARISGMILNINRKRDIFQEKEEGVKGYLQMHKVGPDMETRIIKWFDYIWSTKQDLDEESVLMLLPDKLKTEIARFVHIDVLRKVRLFEDADEQFLEELVLKLQFQPFSPGDYICRKGDIGRQMYVVRRGKLNVVSDDGTKVFATLGAGTVFGELSILNIPGSKNGNRRTANVCAVGYADLFSLSKEDLWEAVREYPEVRASLLSRARLILKKDDLIDEAAAVELQRTARNFVAVTTNLESSLDILGRHMRRFMEDYVGAVNSMNAELSELEVQIHHIATRPWKPAFCRELDDRQLHSAGDVMLDDKIPFDIF